MLEKARKYLKMLKNQKPSANSTKNRIRRMPCRSSVLSVAANVAIATFMQVGTRHQGQLLFDSLNKRRRHVGL